MKNLLAATQYNPLGEPIRGIGPLGLQGVPAVDLGKIAPATFVDAISKIVGFLTAVAIIWFVFQFILGAMSWITSGGDAKAVEGAKAKLTNAIIGIVIVIAALVLTATVGALLGIDLLNLGGFITQLTPGDK